MGQSSSADTEAVTLRAMTPDDWPRVAEILAAGLEEGQATFETRVPDWEDWDRSHLPGLRLVAVDADGQVVGWVAASPVSRRVVYEGVVEHSIYVDAGARGRGVGRTLLERFITDSENAGVWTRAGGDIPRERGESGAPPRVRVPGCRDQEEDRPSSWCVAGRGARREAKPRVR